MVLEGVVPFRVKYSYNKGGYPIVTFGLRVWQGRKRNNPDQDFDWRMPVVIYGELAVKFAALAKHWDCVRLSGSLKKRHLTNGKGLPYEIKVDDFFIVNAIKPFLAYPTTPAESEALEAEKRP